MYSKVFRKLDSYLQTNNYNNVTVLVDKAKRSQTWVENYLKKHQVDSPESLQEAKIDFYKWLNEYYILRTRKPSIDKMSAYLLTGTIYLYAVLISKTSTARDEYLVEKTILEFNKKREYLRVFKLL